MNQEQTKERIIELLTETHRVGMPELIEYLGHRSDFFTAPASTKHHGAHIGGLAEHSLNVYDIMVRLDREFGDRDVLDDFYIDHSITTVALLHDICKTNYYANEQKWRKDDYGKWEAYGAWVVKDQLPLGHGEKSLYIISKFLNLADVEALAIRWHMGAWTPGVTTDYAISQAFNAAVDKHPLVPLLQMADFAASRQVGVR